MSEYELSLLRQRGLAARDAKASLGELRFTLPPGFCWSEDDRIEMDPDERVQQAIRLIFAKFRELGSGRQVFLWLRAADIHLPVALRNGALRKIAWRKPAYRSVMQVLHNPIYAGAYPMTNLANTLVSQIAAHISADGLRPGDRLTERKLAEQFRVSRSPVRAALKQLEEAGVLTSGERSGYRLVDAQAAQQFNAPAAEVDEDERIYLKIADDRVTGKLPERMTESEFQRRYDLTKGRVTKLLNRMAQEGWIERLPGHGWEFLPVLTSLESYRDSYRFRQLIEPAALLEPRFQLNRPALESRLAEQRWLVECGIWDIPDARLFELNSGMHESVIECSQNIFFIDALKRVDRLRRLIDYRQMDLSRFRSGLVLMLSGPLLEGHG